MKPTKNRFFCRACGKAKMLFETERQALNYIRFNSEEVTEENGHAPVRAYYCNVCMGWHVTSNRNEEHFMGWKSKAEMAVDSFIKQKETKQEIAKTKMFNDGIEFYAMGEHAKATDCFLLSFHSQKDMNATEQSTQCQESAREAFTSACREFSAILEKENPGSDDVKRCTSLIKRLTKVSGFFKSRFDDALSSLTLANEKIKKKSVGITNVRTQDEMEAEMAESLRIMEAKEARKRMERVECVQRDLSVIYSDILAGQRMESERLLRCVTAEIRDLLEHEELREYVLPFVDDVVKVGQLFKDAFMSGQDAAADTI